MRFDPDTIGSVELAWFGPGRAQDVAYRFRNMTRGDVERIWERMRARENFGPFKRPAGGWPWSLARAGEAQEFVKRCLIDARPCQCAGVAA